MDIKLLEALSNAVGIGHITDARELVRAELEKYAEVESFGQTGLIAKIDKKKDRTILLDAHIDEVGFIVTHIFDGGFLRVTKVGGNDSRMLPATPVVIHSENEVDAVFTSVPPHLAKKSGEAASIDELMLDCGIENTADAVAIGDLVTCRKSFSCLGENRVTGKALDDRAGVFCLIEIAKRIYDKPLDCNVVLLITEQEELGTRGAVTAGFAVDADEAIAIDVSFGDAPDVKPEHSGRLGGGAMLGISPVLSRKMSDALKNIAENKKIAYQFEVMGGKTGTDADALSITKSGLPCALVSIPLRNMHTPAEVIDLRDLDSVCSLIEEYIIGGGAGN